MNTHRKSIASIFIVAGTLIGLSLFSLNVEPALAQDPVPTPTYDPLGQPDLPPNPTDLEMGRYLFWRHCMPCHGDIGQGLTDEFRLLWEDHANCWDRGCHGGRQEDEGFPIPTVIPAIVTEDHLDQFTSEEELLAFLKATHPPQYPGFLEDDEYHDIITVLFSMNERSAEEEETVVEPTFTPTWTSTPLSTVTSTPVVSPPVEDGLTIPLVIAAGSTTAIVAAFLLWSLRRSKATRHQ